MYYIYLLSEERPQQRINGAATETSKAKCNHHNPLFFGHLADVERLIAIFLARPTVAAA